MADYNQSAWFKVRRWFLSEMFSSGVLQENDYQNSSVIVPIQQIPENITEIDFQGSGLPSDAPFIVYDIVVPGGYGTDYWNRRDEVMLWLYDYDVNKLFAMSELVQDLFGRFDESARDLNNFEANTTPFTYHWADVMMGLPTDEGKDILGRTGMNIVVTYEYTRNLASNGRFA